MQRAYQNKTQRSTFTLNTKKNDTVDVPSCQQLLPGLFSDANAAPMSQEWLSIHLVSETRVSLLFTHVCILYSREKQ